MLSDTSTNRQHRRLVSSSYCLTYSRSCLAHTFQSTRRKSSPGTYSRCCRNSTDCPKYGLRCIPLSRPSTMCRARISNRPIRLITSGCKDLLEAVVMDQGVFVRGGDFQEVVDDVVGGDTFALGGEIHHQPVPQHRFGERLNVLDRHVRSALYQGPRFRAQDQELRRPWPGPPRQLLPHIFRDARL